jgi:hypothetical protein
VNVHLSGDIVFSTTSYVQVAFADPGDVRVLGIAQLTTPLLGKLQQTTSVNFRVDSEPPRGVEKTDVKISTSFGLDF